MFTMSVPMCSDEAKGRVWRRPCYDKGGYDKGCLVQAAIAECVREMFPRRRPTVHRRDDVLAAGVRDLVKLKKMRASEAQYNQYKAFTRRQFKTRIEACDSHNPKTAAASAVQVQPPPVEKPAMVRKVRQRSEQKNDQATAASTSAEVRPAAA
eukprot:TRINITY_DN21872_c0_g1_i10.p1 TRINITY_DN21872_c0_g1~~TRINITY_DN21872_c0_g1_i10.p1  ORF type:complete len:153 (-),score=26.21 TRINITY_DN21872_c0_g1_i10:228-686(-)